MNGLRVSEATGADIGQLGLERGHRTLVITRKGGKVVTIPLAPRTARAIDLAIGERCEGPVFLRPDGRRLATTTIDILYLHAPDPATPLDETLDAVATLQQAAQPQAQPAPDRR